MPWHCTSAAVTKCHEILNFALAWFPLSHEWRGALKVFPPLPSWERAGERGRIAQHTNAVLARTQPLAQALGGALHGGGERWLQACCGQGEGERTR